MKLIDALDCLEHVMCALGDMIVWYGCRRDEDDELLPADQQQPEVQQAMRVLAEARALLEKEDENEVSNDRG